MRKQTYQWIKTLLELVFIFLANHMDAKIKRAGKKLLKILFYGLLLLFFTFAGWLCFMGVLYLKMIEQGISPVLTCLIVGLLQVFMAMLMLFLMRHVKRHFYSNYIARYMDVLLKHGRDED